MATSNIILTQAYASVFAPGGVTASAASAVQIYIMGGSPLSLVDRTAYLMANGLSITWETGGKGRASVRLYDPLGALTYGGGEEITIWYGTTKLFGGNLDRVKFTHENGTDKKLYLDLSCVDYSQRMERRVVTECTLTAGMSLRTAADRILDQYFDGEGFVLSSAIASVSLADDVVISNITVGEAFRKLCEIFNVDLDIDVDRTIRMGTFTGTPAPYTIRDNDNNHDEITVERNRTTYRNVQYVAAGTGIQTSRTETFVGNSSNKVFTLLFPVAEIQSITVDGIHQTYDLATAATWTFGYAVDDRRIWHSPSATALSGTQTLSVTYIARNTDTVAYQDSQQIASRAALEGGSGKHESVYRFFGIQDSALADQIAQSRQERFGDEGIPIEVTFTSQRMGWKPAQTVDIVVSYPPIDAELMIYSVSVTLQDKQIWRYSVQCRAKADGTPARQPIKPADVLGGTSNTTGGTSYNNSSGGGYIEARFVLASNSPSTSDNLELGANVGNPWPIVQTGQSVSATIDFSKNPPTGASIKAQLRINTASELWTVTADAGTDRITHAADHLRQVNDKVVITSSGSVPTGLTAGTMYYLRDVTSTSYKLSATRGGAAIDLTSAGTGTITATFGNTAMGDPLEFPAGRTTPVTVALGGYNITAGKVISLDVLQIGSTNAGSDGSVVLKYARSV